MKKRKILATLVSAAMLATTLASCGDASGSKKKKNADGSQEITWMFWDDLNATEDLISLGYKETIERFNNDYKGKYHVTPITTNLEEYYNNLNAKVAAKETPDVFIVSPGPQLTDYVEPALQLPLMIILQRTAGRILSQVILYSLSRPTTERSTLFR